MNRVALILLMVLAFFVTFFGVRSGIAPGSMVWLIIPVFVVAFAFAFRRIRRANAASIEGIAFMNQGRFMEALTSFERGQKIAPRSHLFPFNRGVVLVSLWRIGEADTAFAQAAAMKVANFGFNLERMVLPQRAIVAALQGKLDDARTHITRAEGLALTRSAHLTIANAVIALREGDPAKARALLAGYEVKMLGGPMRGLADVLTAWCVEQLSGERRPVDKVALFGESGPEGLRLVWPEVIAFVERAPEL
jgi:tetratricopeptide (TPR) repeat protein